MLYVLRRAPPSKTPGSLLEHPHSFYWPFLWRFINKWMNKNGFGLKILMNFQNKTTNATHSDGCCCHDNHHTKLHHTTPHHTTPHHTTPHHTTPHHTTPHHTTLLPTTPHHTTPHHTNHTTHHRHTHRPLRGKASALESRANSCAVWRLVLPLCGVVWCGVVWCGVVRCGAVWCGAVWCGVVWCGVVWCGVVWCGVVWCGVVRCGVLLTTRINSRKDCFQKHNSLLK